MRIEIAGSVLFLLALQPGATPQPLRLVGAIELPGVEGRIDHLAFDPATHRLFVAALGNNTVEVLDVGSQKHLTSLKGFREPQGLAVLTGGNLVAVANGQGDGVQLVDAGTFQTRTHVRLGDDADNVRYDGAANRAYVGFGSGALAAIDTLKGVVLGQAALAGHPESFQLERNGPRIFVNVPSAGHIAVVDRNGTKVVATWPVATAAANFPMALDESNHRLFVGCRRPAKVLVYDTTNGKPLTSFDTVGDTDDLFYDAPRHRLYVSGGDGFLDVSEAGDTGHITRSGHIATAPGARTSLFVSDESRLYLAVPRRGSQRAEIRIYDAR